MQIMIISLFKSNDLQKIQSFKPTTDPPGSKLRTQIIIYVLFALALNLFSLKFTKHLYKWEMFETVMQITLTVKQFNLSTDAAGPHCKGGRSLAKSESSLMQCIEKWIDKKD